MKNIFIVPDGGIGNRLRAIISGIWLANESGNRPIIVWHKDNLCNTFLEKIIDVDKFPADVICPSEFIYKAFFDLPRKRNLFLSKLLAPFRFQKDIMMP